jgi:hypothetical protein
MANCWLWHSSRDIQHIRDHRRYVWSGHRSSRRRLLRQGIEQHLGMDGLERQDMTPRGDNPKESGKETTPTRFPETTPQVYPGSDYSFTLQAVMEMQKSVGILTEAVNALKQQTAKHDDKLSEIGKDVHTVKTTARVIGVILAGALAFASWGIGKAVDVFVKLYQPSAVQRQIPPQSPELPK